MLPLTIRYLSVLLAVVLTAGASRALADPLIAVASNFAKPMEAILQAFESETGIKPTVSYGSSGKLFAQIRHGAPFEIFLSADQAKPIALESAGLIVPDSRFTYAQGRLVLWSSLPVEIDESSLTKAEIERLALANPRLAPYGKAATEVLEQLSLSESTRSRWVIGENISQTYMFVDSGNADLGFVAASQVMRNDVIVIGSGWLVPNAMHEPIRQDAVLLTAATDNPKAMRFFEYLSSERVSEILQEFGYITGERS